MPTANAVYDLLFVSNYLFAATNPFGDVLMSQNFGNSWTNTGDLTGATYAYSLIYKLNSPYQYHLFCGTGNNGDVFRSTQFLGEEESYPGKPTDKYIKNMEFITPPTFFKENIPIKFTSFSKDPLKIELYNSIGMKVYNLSLPSTCSFTLGDEAIKKLKDGIYYLKVYYGKNKTKTVRLIKK